MERNEAVFAVGRTSRRKGAARDRRPRLFSQSLWHHSSSGPASTAGTLPYLGAQPGHPHTRCVMDPRLSVK